MTGSQRAGSIFRKPRENRLKENSMLQRLFRSTGMAVLLAASTAIVAPNVNAQKDPQAHILASEATLSNFLRDPDMDWLQKNFNRAKAVIITPEIVKAGFIFGGSGGRALVVARDPKSGKWLGPVFYAMATASVGFQAGVSVAEGVTLVMTEKGFNSLLATSFKIGGDASVAAGPVGAGARSDVVADLITFNRAKGVYGGLNLDGTVVTASDDWNSSFYGKKVLPPDILVRASAHNKSADKLLAQVAAAAAKK
jgi:lipid-binding SYLF domain-containing protein